MIDAAHQMLAVIVEGPRHKIHELFVKLVSSSPKTIQYTNITWSKSRAGVDNNLKLNQTLELIVQLLKEIEKNTRRLNQKIDKAGLQEVWEKQGAESMDDSDDSLGVDVEDSTGGVADGDDEVDDASDGFSLMFG